MRRERSLLIHWLSPLRVAMAPSMVDAHLAITCGRPVMWRLMKGSSTSNAAACSMPTPTLMPAFSNILMPLPLTRGFGSTQATSTCFTPASIRAEVHGGVLPWWQQGSSET
jgi:hypothetical protein